jgi:hypothetical protein
MFPSLIKYLVNITPTIAPKIILFITCFKMHHLSLNRPLHALDSKVGLTLLRHRVPPNISGAIINRTEEGNAEWVIQKSKFIYFL